MSTQIKCLEVELQRLEMHHDKYAITYFQELVVSASLCPQSI